MPVELKDCPDCGVKPGQAHKRGCDIETCSSCGLQRMSCDCIEHDPLFSRWTGFFPGEIESAYLKIDLNEFYLQGLSKIFFVKPEINKRRQYAI